MRHCLFLSAAFTMACGNLTPKEGIWTMVWFQHNDDGCNLGERGLDEMVFGWGEVEAFAFDLSLADDGFEIKSVVQPTWTNIDEPLACTLDSDSDIKCPSISSTEMDTTSSQELYASGWFLNTKFMTLNNTFQYEDSNLQNCSSEFKYELKYSGQNDSDPDQPEPDQPEPDQSGPDLNLEGTGWTIDALTREGSVIWPFGEFDPQPYPEILFTGNEVMLSYGDCAQCRFNYHADSFFGVLEVDYSTATLQSCADWDYDRCDTDSDPGHLLYFFAIMGEIFSEYCGPEYNYDVDGDRLTVAGFGCEVGFSAARAAIPEPELGVAVDWGDNAVSLTIENGSEEAEYMWGIAETADSSDPWTGEDCYGGYELPNGSLLAFCHPVAVDGGMLAYGASPNTIVESATTVFGGSSYDNLTTHILDDYATGGSCWVWGEDTAYYADYGKTCTEL